MRASSARRRSAPRATDLFVSQVAPGERVELVTARAAAQPGRAGAQTPSTLRSAAPFGVAERRRPSASAGRALVLPRVEPLGDLPFLAPASTHERRSAPDPRRGAGPEYLGIREYRPGDSLATCIGPRPLARDGHGARVRRGATRRLPIVVDTLTDVGEEWTPLDACCTAAASIARVAFDEGHTLRMISARPGRSVDVSDDVDEGSHRRRLAAIVPDGVPLAEFVDQCADAFRDVDVVVLVFPTWRTNGDGALVRAIEAMSAARTSVVAVPVEVGSDDARRIASLGPVEVDVLVRALVRSGADVYPWRQGTALDVALTREPVVTT